MSTHASRSGLWHLVRRVNCSLPIGYVVNTTPEKKRHLGVYYIDVLNELSDRVFGSMNHLSRSFELFWDQRKWKTVIFQWATCGLSVCIHILFGETTSVGIVDPRKVAMLDVWIITFVISFHKQHIRQSKTSKWPFRWKILNR